MTNLWQSISGFPIFLGYFGLALALLALFMAVYVRITPCRELALIREGNLAAAVSLSGATLGFVLPLASAVAHSVSPADMVAWSVVALLVQIVVYVVFSRLVPRAAQAIAEGKVAVAAFNASLAVAVGILNAACLTY